MLSLKKDINYIMLILTPFCFILPAAGRVAGYLWAWIAHQKIIVICRGYGL